METNNQIMKSAFFGRINLKVFTLLSITLMPYVAKSQSNSSMDGNWDNGTNWTSGVPKDDEAVNITNNMTLDADIDIDDNGSYVVNNGSIIDPTGGNAYKIKIKGTGYLEVSGNVTIEGELKVEDDGELIIRGCDTLRVGGKLELKDNAKLTLEDCAVIIVGGDLKFKDDVLATIDGNIVVDGKVESKDDAIISGAGKIESDGKIKVKDNSTLFGSGTGCNSGPCVAGTGNALPIVLGDFEANFIGTDAIEVKWETHSEINNDFFTLYYSTDGLTFIEAKTILGAGNSNEKLTYKAVINNLNSKTVYLKLKQTDFDGKHEEFKPIVVHNKSSFKPISEDVLLFPNPGDGRSIFIVLADLKPHTFKINLFNSSVEQILTKPITNHENKNSLKIELLEGVILKKGLYIIQILSSDTKIEKKYIVY